MKRMKKAASLVLVSAMVMVSALMAGCGKKETPETLMKNLAESGKEIKSMDAKMTFDMDLTAEGQNIKMKMDADMESIIKSGEAHVKGKMDMSIPGSNVSTEIEMYQVKEDDKLAGYINVMDTWQKQVIDIPKENSMDMYKEFEKSFAEFELNEKFVKVNGKDCYELKGDIGAEVLDYILKSGAAEQAGVEEFFNKEAMKDMKIPCTLDIYKDGALPARVAIDMKDVFKGMEGMEEIKIDKCKVDVIYNEFDKVKEIKVPKEAVENAVMNQNTLKMNPVTGDTM